MAYSIIAKPNTDPVTGTNPYGKIRDDVAPGTGTPVNTLVYGDQHQFFARMMAAAGITPNNAPDNGSSNNQLYDALIEISQSSWSNSGITFPTTGGVTFSDVAGALYGVSAKVSRNEIALCGSASVASVPSPGAFVVIELPVGKRPSKIVYPLAMVKIGATEAVQRIEIGTDGKVKVTTGSTSGIQVWLDGVTFRI